MVAGQTPTISGRHITGGRMPTNKALGQHWLRDRFILSEIADAAHILSRNTVLEIGPGLGTLTSELLSRASHVIAVEYDKDLAFKLPGQFPGKNLDVINQDILQFDLTQLPPNYVVVANVPYYITSKIVQKLMTTKNKPRIAVLLVQKEVAHRIAAGPGEMSMLALGAQVFADAILGIEVPKEFFTPPPKVDSQVVILETRQLPLVPEHVQKQFFRVARAGFSEKRKKLRSSLAGGLRMDKQVVDDLLQDCDISIEARAQELSVAQWLRIATTIRG